jgi:competence protein ComEC
VFVVPLLGTITSSCIDYVRAVRPVLAIVSTGYLNAYHHPAAEVVARYDALGIPLLNTPSTGAVRIGFPVSAAPRIVAEGRRRRAHYWREP